MARAFVRWVIELQRAAVKDWNQFCDNVTLSYNMSVVGVREDSSDGAAAVILDMLLNFGVLVFNQDETWALHCFTKLHRSYCFGDRKSVENSSAFVTKLRNRNLSFEESSLQVKIFLDAFDWVMFLPDDWHVCLNMLQAIYKLFWSDLLKLFRYLLLWQRISKDAWDCYFQASLLVEYSNIIMSLYLISLYLLQNKECYEVRMSENKPANVLCQIAADFEMFLSRALLSSNKHLKLVVKFLLVSSVFLEFVGVYKLQDSITAENGYKAFAPIWKILGQVKYLEATWEQMDSLCRNFPYSKM
jgi:hypothetical protein